MKKKQFAFGMVPALAAALVTGGAAQAQDLFSADGGFNGGGYPTGGLVYDNTLNFLGFLINGNEDEWGDGVTLAGTNRVVTNIGLMIHGLGAGNTGDLTVRIFAGGDDPAANDPGALLWQSDTFSNFFIAPGSSLYDFAVPNVLVGDSLTWTLQLANLQGDPEFDIVGSRFMDPPTLGSSQDFIWLHNPDSTWSSFAFGVGGDNNFGAIITAVPAPGALALLGLAGLAARRRRRA